MRLPTSSLASRIPRRAAALALVATSLVAAACGSGTVASAGGAQGGRGRRIEVVAAENFWGSVASQLGGDHVEVASIVSNPDTDPHDYEPSAADGRTVAQAGYVIENGLGYDTWMSQLVAANDTSGQKVLDVGKLLGLHVGDNPHRWYYPQDVERVIDRITADYRAIDPADAAYFDQRRDEFERVGLARYHQLIGQIRSRYSGTPVGASESIFEGLAEATGLRLLTPVRYLDAISEGTDPTAADKTTVDDQITRREIAVFVFNSQNATPDVRALVRAADARRVPVVTITETLSPVGVTFQDWQSVQLERLERALGEATGR